MSFNSTKIEPQIISSSFGNNLKITIFGGSHEDHIGVTMEGLPSGVEIDFDRMQTFLNRRAPGNSIFTTPRKEADIPIVRSGLADGKTTSEPLTLIIENTNTRSSDYKSLGDVPRPAHADFTASVKYGAAVNMAGGGPFSARMTAPLCVAGAIALQILEKKGIFIGAHIFSVGNVCDLPFDPVNPTNGRSIGFKNLNDMSFPVLDIVQGEKMGDLIKAALSEGDSVGGVVECCAVGVPAGLGGPMYDSLEGSLAKIFFGIPAVKGIEFGAGFEAAKLLGSENNDAFCMDNGIVRTVTNNHGGILGGISSGMPILCRLAFKPTPSISKEQDSVSLSMKTNQKLTVSGRHDPCVVVRAVPVVEAAMALGILDLLIDINI